MGAVALDLTETYRVGLSPHLYRARRVADPCHVTRVANRVLDQVCRRPRPGRDACRTALRRSSRRDARRLVGQKAVRSTYLSDDVEEATVLLDNSVEARASDDVPVIRTMAQTYVSWHSAQTLPDAAQRADIQTAHSIPSTQKTSANPLLFGRQPIVLPNRDIEYPIVFLAGLNFLQSRSM